MNKIIVIVYPTKLESMNACGVFAVFDLLKTYWMATISADALAWWRLIIGALVTNG